MMPLLLRRPMLPMLRMLPILLMLLLLPMRMHDACCPTAAR